MGDLIQHSDINVGPASYAELAPDELLVTKIWYTLQGEGPYAGFPAIFLRLAGCNRGRKEDMGCKFCDTQFYFAKGTRMSFNRIVDLFYQEWHKTAIHWNTGPSAAGELPLVVITGGEPMLQDNLVGFLEFLAREGWNTIQIESNGDRVVVGFLDNRYCETVDLVISPKIVTYRYLPMKGAILKRASALKFVISGDPASPYYSLPDYATHKDPDQVFLSPLTVYAREVLPHEIGSAWPILLDRGKDDNSMVDLDATKLNYKRAAQLALKHGYRVSMQQHLWFCVE